MTTPPRFGAQLAAAAPGLVTMYDEGSIPLERWLLGPGIAATLAANVAHGLGHGLIGAAVAAWPAVALVGSYELLMLIIRGTQARPETTGMPPAPDADPLQGQAAQAFADDLVGSRVPPVRAIRARLHVGT